MNEPDSHSLREKVAALPRTLTPARDLWPGIQAQLASPPATLARTAPSPLRLWLPRLGLAAVLLIGAIVAVSWRDRGPSWNVVSLSGAPQINARPVAATAQWHRGEWIETDASSRAKLEIGTIGEVRVDPNSRLRLLGMGANNHRLELERGTLHALIWAPPRLFFVETPSATAIDLGCAYTLTVDDAGVGVLRVTSGYVALEHEGRESLIPAGRMCLTRKGSAPGTPFSEGSSPALRAALERFDFAAGGDVALAEVITHAQPGDEVTLWHLLSRVSLAPQRSAVFEKLASLHAPPSGVTRAGILAGEKTMLRDWGSELGLPRL